jgi:hypothetical protein
MNESDNELSPGEFDNVKYKATPYQPKMTFFYEKNDETVFAAEEQEAANGKYNKKFRFLGWSNGQIYSQTIKAANLKKGQVISKDEAQVLLNSAFEAELKVAKSNLAEAKKNGTRIPRPMRTEWYFDGSVPEKDREYFARSNNYGQARINNN